MRMKAAVSRGRLVASVGSLAVVAAALTSCGAGVREFRRQSERFLESSEMSDAQGHTFSDAACEEPADTQVGTTFECTATDELGRPWSFTVVVTEDQGILVSDGAPTR